MDGSLSNRLIAYLEPLILLSFALIFLPRALVLHPLLLVSSPSKFRSEWFASYWKYLGPKMAASPVQVDYIDALMTRAHGTVLELGPGGGDRESPIPHLCLVSVLKVV